MLLQYEWKRELVSFQVLSELYDDTLISHKRIRYAILFTESDHATAWSQRIVIWPKQRAVNTYFLTLEIMMHCITNV